MYDELSLFTFFPTRLKLLELFRRQCRLVSRLYQHGLPRQFVGDRRRNIFRYIDKCLKEENNNNRMADSDKCLPSGIEVDG